MPGQETRERLVGEFPDAGKFIDRFVALGPTKFALIKLGGEIVDNDELLGQTANDLADLYRVGLTPVVLHGAGDQIEEALKSRGMSSEKDSDGLRITPPLHMELIEGVFTDVNIRLKNAVNDAGGQAVGINNIFATDLTDPGNRASITKITEVDTSRVERIARAGIIPIVSSYGHFNADPNLRTNVNADVSATRLARELGVSKYIILTAIGGIYDGDEKKGQLNRDEALGLIDSGVINGGMVPKVKAALSITGKNAPDIVIAGPEGLPHELYSEEGDGTIIHVH